MKSYYDAVLNAPKPDIYIEERLENMPFADVCLNGQKRFWYQLTEQEKHHLAQKYPARPDLPYGLRVLTTLSTMYEVPINYAELASHGHSVSSITHVRRDPMGFTTGHALMQNPLRRRIPKFIALALPISLIPFTALIALKQYQHGFWFRGSA
uniref:Uncharacterized protein n=1 Tax=Lygus hesperus TaxID=30085 RepID=A0A0A9YHF2_LYGHE